MHVPDLEPGFSTIWDTTTGKEVQTLEGHSKLEGHSSSVKSVAFSSDSKLIASGSDGRTVKIWDATTGKEIQILKSHSSWVESVAFSPDSKLVASGSNDMIVKIWDTSTGKEVQTLEGHGSSVKSVAFSPDSKLVASGSDDGIIKIWDAATGKEVQTLEGHNSYVNSIFSGDDMARIGDATYGLSADKSWITWNKHNVLRLPTDYRPSSSAISSSTIAIGCSSGRVLIIGFLGQPYRIIVAS